MSLTQSHTQIDVKQEKTSTCLNKSRIFLTSNVARMINDFFTRTEVLPIQYFPTKPVWGLMLGSFKVITNWGRAGFIC